ncbi:MAG: protein kinase [Planctomycetales bacterium]|nr:protein kinase [Planctomycetales bacterium]
MAETENLSDEDLELEELILRFDQLRAVQEEIDVTSWLENLNFQSRCRALTEMACIDLERAFEAGSLPPVSPFLGRFPNEFLEDEFKREVAVEHIRLGRQFGIELNVSALAGQYGISEQSLQSTFGKSSSSSIWSVAGSTVVRNDSPINDEVFPSVGDTFCGYPILLELGRGAIGRAYLARQPDLAGRPVVLKVTSKFVAEAEKLARLQHSGIIPVYSIHKEGQLFAICMPCLGAVTLSQLISSLGLLDSENWNQEAISTLVGQHVSTMVERSISMDPVIEPQATVESQRVSRSNTSDGEPVVQLLGLNELTTSLASILSTKDQFQTKLKLAIEICDAVAHAHEHGIIHRDLKPENILIANDGRPVILDFNLAVQDGQHGTELAGGTIPYMSLQQLRAFLGQTHKPSFSDDVFSLGVIFYQLFCGRHPFRFRYFSTIEQAIEVRCGSDIGTMLRQFEPNLKGSLSAILEKCLTNDPANRYRSALELGEDLKREQASQVLKYASERGVSTRIRKWARRHPVLASNFSLVTIASALILLTSWAWFSARQRSLSSWASQQSILLASQISDAEVDMRSPGLEVELMTQGLGKAQRVLEKWLAPHSGENDPKPFEHLDNMAGERAALQLARLVSLGQETHRKLTLIAPTQAQKFDLNFDEFRQSLGKQSPTPDADLYEQDDVLRKLYQSSDLQLFLESADKRVATDPTDPSGWFTLATAHWALGNISQALDAFDVAAKLQPASNTAVFWKAICQMQLQRYEEALKNFRLVQQRDVNWIAPRYNSVLCLMQSNRADEALSEIEQLSLARNVSARIHSLHANLLSRAGKTTEAEAARDRALQCDPQDVDDLVTQGVLMLASSPESGLQKFQAALQMDPNHLAALQNCAQVLSESMKDTVNAVDYMTRILRLRPKSASALASRGVLYGRLGQIDQAIADARAAQNTKPGALEMLQLAGIYSLVCESTNSDTHQEQALQWLSRAVTANPGLVTIASVDPDLQGLRTHGDFHRLLGLTQHSN